MPRRDLQCAVRRAAYRNDGALDIHEEGFLFCVGVVPAEDSRSGRRTKVIKRQIAAEINADGFAPPRIIFTHLSAAIESEV